MQRMIHFLKPNRYGIHVGEDRLFNYGEAELLVMRGIAAWVDEPIVEAGISEPVATAEPEELPADEPETKETPKRRKRSDSTEEGK